jgi:hypothetical protein
MLTSHIYHQVVGTLQLKVDITHIEDIVEFVHVHKLAGKSSRGVKIFEMLVVG